jgi:hypothetical protein
VYLQLVCKLEDWASIFVVVAGVEPNAAHFILKGLPGLEGRSPSALPVLHLIRDAGKADDILDNGVVILVHLALWLVIERLVRLLTPAPASWT